MNGVHLYLVRHGAVVSAGGKAFIGQIDLPISEEGVEQAWALRQWLEPVSFTRVICSDLLRCHRSAQIIAGRAAPIESMPALREINLGDWEGFSFQEIQERFPEAYAARGRDMENWRPPRGESFADCHARVDKALREILVRSKGNVLLVGHAGVNRLILCTALGIPVRNLHSLGQDYGCVNIVEFGPDRTRIRLMNYTPLPRWPRKRHCFSPDTVRSDGVMEVQSVDDLSR